MIQTEPEYRDPFIEITEDGILFKAYSLKAGDRFVSFDDIEKLVIKKPSICNGKWRLSGTHDFKTWFPADSSRQERDVIFVAHIRKKWWRVGFTVENSTLVAGILQEKGLIDNTEGLSLAEVAEWAEEKKSNRSRNRRENEKFLLIFGLVIAFIPLITVVYIILALIFGWEFNRG